MKDLYTSSVVGLNVKSKVEFSPSAVSASQTAHQTEPPGPHLCHLQQGVQEQLQPAAAPVGAHRHQDEGQSKPREGGRREGRTSGEADSPSFPPSPHPSCTVLSSPSPCSCAGDPPPARSACEPGGPASLCVHCPSNRNHGSTASAHPSSCCCCWVHGAGGFTEKGVIEFNM